MTAFDKLDPVIQRWIWEKKWAELRDVQEKSINAILGHDRPVLISASTAAGKTEAAFFPILTKISGVESDGFSVLNISPLKALINDQFQRLEHLCERLDTPLVRWHGDAPQAPKIAAAKRASGVCLITPESIEALLCRRPGVARKLFGNLKYVIIDELHYFLEGPRGLHLSSLLNRLDGISGIPARRIGLSATLGDLELARSYLTAGSPEACDVVLSDAGKPELRLQIKAYLEAEETNDPDALEGEEGEALALDRIADDIFRYFRGSSNLVFAGSRRRVESLTDRLRNRCESQNVPNEFFAHHGSLAKEMREELESRLRTSRLPTTAVATTTLELGIDIGDITAVAQVGAPTSLASLRQRLGRAGRREGVPAVLRLFVREWRSDEGSDILIRLNLELVKSIAAIRLLIAGYLERPQSIGFEPSVVFQQILSVICECGGVSAPDLYRNICEKGALAGFPKADFAKLLKGMGDAGFLEQSKDRLIMLGEVGEKVTQKKDFFALFETIDEWKIVTAEKPLGSLPLSNMLGVGSVLAFAGKRWRVEAVDQVGRVITVVGHRSGKVPQFEALAFERLDDRLVQEMKKVWEEHDVPAFLDREASRLLQKSRAIYHERALSRVRFCQAGKNVHILTWSGSVVNTLLELALKALGYSAMFNGIGVTVMDCQIDRVEVAVKTLATASFGIDKLAEQVDVLQVGKWDDFVPEDVLRSQWKRSYNSYWDELGALLERLSEAGWD